MLDSAYLISDLEHSSMRLLELLIQKVCHPYFTEEMFSLNESFYDNCTGVSIKEASIFHQVFVQTSLLEAFSSSDPSVTNDKT